MNRIEIYSDAEDIHSAIGALWQSAPFRASYEEGGYAYQMVDRLAEAPVALFEPTDAKFELEGFFGDWMRAIPHPQYSRKRHPSIKDWELLHHILHVVTLRFDPNSSQQDFEERMRDNAVATNFHSNLWLYFQIQAARADSPRKSIWADRYLDDRKSVVDGVPNRELMQSDPLKLLVGLMKARIDAVLSPNGRQELKLRYFERLGIDFAEFLDPHFAEIDQFILEFRELALSDRGAAADMLRRWIIEQQGGNVCPFEEAFRGFQARVEATYASAASYGADFPLERHRPRYTGMLSKLEEVKTVDAFMALIEGRSV